MALLKKRIIICLCSVAIFASIVFLITDFMIMDDYHPSNLEELYQDLVFAEDGTISDDPPSTQDSSSSDTSPAVRKGWHIHVSLDSCLMYVYKDGNLIKTYPVSGGSPRTPSPLGTWKIITKDTWGEGFGGAWLGFNVPWGKYGIHGTTEPWFVGKSNSSKGCIRMKNKDVRELYKMVPHGTTVTIVHHGWVFRTLKSGAIGSDVLEVQKALKKLNYYPGYPDGKFGNGLKNAVMKFQKAHKLKPTGIIDRRLYDLIMQQYKELETQESQDSTG